MSAFRRRGAGQGHTSAANRNDDVARMPWRQFEVLVGEYFRRQGFASMDGGGGLDGGVDVVLKNGADRYLVRCKYWRAMRVDVQAVRDLYGAMAAQHVVGAYIVTSGDFTDEARKFAEAREIEADRRQDPAARHPRAGRRWAGVRALRRSQGGDSRALGFSAGRGSAGDG